MQMIADFLLKNRYMQANLATPLILEGGKISIHFRQKEKIAAFRKKINCAIDSRVKINPRALNCMQD